MEEKRTRDREKKRNYEQFAGYKQNTEKEVRHHIMNKQFEQARCSAPSAILCGVLFWCSENAYSALQRISLKHIHPGGFVCKVMVVNFVHAMQTQYTRPESHQMAATAIHARNTQIKFHSEYLSLSPKTLYKYILTYTTTSVLQPYVHNANTTQPTWGFRCRM